MASKQNEGDPGQVPGDGFKNLQQVGIRTHEFLPYQGESDDPGNKADDEYIGVAQEVDDPFGIVDNWDGQNSHVDWTQLQDRLLTQHLYIGLHQGCCIPLSNCFHSVPHCAQQEGHQTDDDYQISEMLDCTHWDRQHATFCVPPPFGGGQWKFAGEENLKKNQN